MVSKEEILQYWYDYDLQTVCKLFHLKEDAVLNIINPKYTQYQYNTVNYKDLPSNSDKVARILSDNYNILYKSIIKDPDSLKLSQTEEDLFQLAIIRTIETQFKEITEIEVIKQFYIKFKMLKKYNQIQYYNMKNKLTPLEIQTEEGDYTESYAVLKKNTETTDFI